MRWLVNYIRQCFCTNEWTIEEDYAEEIDDLGNEAKGTRVYMRCKKCGYHQTHWKF